MGLLTELFVARESDAITYDGTSAPRFGSVQLGGLTSLQFETLWAILRAEKWDVQSHALDAIASTDEEWTFRFPTAYVDRLKALDRETISHAAKIWSSTEEMRCKPEDAEAVILQLAAIARSVADDRLGLYLWFSL